jgi:hypothetical protein
LTLSAQDECPPTQYDSFFTIYCPLFNVSVSFMKIAKKNLKFLDSKGHELGLPL